MKITKSRCGGRKEEEGERQRGIRRKETERGKRKGETKEAKW